VIANESTAESRFPKQRRFCRQSRVAARNAEHAGAKEDVSSARQTDARDRRVERRHEQMHETVDRLRGAERQSDSENRKISAEDQTPVSSSSSSSSSSSRHGHSDTNAHPRTRASRVFQPSSLLINGVVANAMPTPAPTAASLTPTPASAVCAPANLTAGMAAHQTPAPAAIDNASPKFISCVFIVFSTKTAVSVPTTIHLRTYH
jgi:hypothetical protein